MKSTVRADSIVASDELWQESDERPIAPSVCTVSGNSCSVCSIWRELGGFYGEMVMPHNIHQTSVSKFVFILRL